MIVRIENFQEKVNNIIKEQVPRLETRLNTKFTEEEILDTKNKSLDLLNFEYKKICSYSGNHISTLSEVTLKKYEDFEDYIILKMTPNKNVKILKSEIQKTMNDFLNKDFETAFVFGLVGRRR